MRLSYLFRKNRKSVQTLDPRQVELEQRENEEVEKQSGTSIANQSSVRKTGNPMLQGNFQGFTVQRLPEDKENS